MRFAIAAWQVKLRRFLSLFDHRIPPFKWAGRIDEEFVNAK